MAWLSLILQELVVYELTILKLLFELQLFLLSRVLNLLDIASNFGYFLLWMRLDPFDVEERQLIDSPRSNLTFLAQF